MSTRTSKSGSRPPCQLYVITPPEIVDVDGFLENLEAALSAAPHDQPIACLQIRLKDAPDTDVLAITKAVLPIAHRYNTRVVVNDRPDLAKKVGADGAHIGQSDMDYFSSRELLGEDAILGVTCHNSRELAFEAAEAGASYVAFGAFFDTPTKTPKTRAELEVLTWWDTHIEVPSVAIGGITVNNATSVIAAGADFIAVSSGIWGHPQGPAQAVTTLSELCLAHSPSV